MYRLLALLAKCENIRLEPSALAGFSGVSKVVQLWEEIGISAEKNQAHHLIWATGGNMVPDDIWREYRKQGIST
jgi:D-serine dehydratase